MIEARALSRFAVMLSCSRMVGETWKCVLHAFTGAEIQG